MTWLGPPKGIYIDFKEINSLQNVITFELMKASPWLSKIRFQWSVRGVGGTEKKIAIDMDKKAALKNGDSNLKFIIDKGYLYKTGEYQVVLNMYATEFSDALIWESINNFKIVTQPYGGSITIDKP